MRAWVFIREIIGGLLRFLMPWACGGCRTPLESIEDTGFCGRCWVSMPRIDGTVCQPCGVPLKDGGETCFSCHQEPPVVVVRAATSYRFPIQPAIHRFKYSGRKTLLPPFRVLLEYAWERYPELHTATVLVPIPLHRATLHDRGYNQAELLAKALSESIDLPVRSDVLIRGRRTRPQFELDKAERLHNLQNAFKLAPGVAPDALQGAHVLLIDDVCTTAATLRECGNALKRAGAAQVKGLVLARDI